MPISHAFDDPSPWSLPALLLARGRRPSRQRQVLVVTIDAQRGGWGHRAPRSRDRWTESRSLVRSSGGECARCREVEASRYLHCPNAGASQVPAHPRRLRNTAEPPTSAATNPAAGPCYRRPRDQPGGCLQASSSAPRPQWTIAPHAGLLLVAGNAITTLLESTFVKHRAGH